MAMISASLGRSALHAVMTRSLGRDAGRSEEHTSELQSQSKLVCRLLLEKNKLKYLRPARPDPAEGILNSGDSIRQPRLIRQAAVERNDHPPVDAPHANPLPRTVVSPSHA